MDQGGGKKVENIIEETNAYFETIVTKEVVEKETSLSDSKAGDAEMVNLKVNAIEKRLSGIYEEIKKGSSMTKVETMMKNLKEACAMDRSQRRVVGNFCFARKYAA